MLPNHVALVPEAPDTVNSAELARVSAAIQQQITRDFAPRWNLSATVDAFPRLEEVPLGYWPIIVTARDLEDDEGFHKTNQGEPFALVESTPGWSVTASHEILEMLVDPSGQRTVAGREPDGVARVEFLLEICDPCQSAGCAYTVNDVLVSDFVTPGYFAPDPGPDSSYSYGRNLSTQHGVTEGGSLTWIDRVRNVVGHLRMENGTLSREEFPLDETDVRPLRARIHHMSKKRRPQARLTSIEHALKVTRKQQASSEAMRTRAAGLRVEIAKLGAPAPRRLPDADDVVVGQRITAALAHRAALEPELVTFLTTAQDQLKSGNPNLSDQWALAMVRSSLRVPVRPIVLTERDVPGIGQYDQLDVRWAKALWEYLTTSKATFPVCPQISWDTLVQPIADTAVIAITGDWGTHNASSAAIGAAMLAVEPTHTIHLGDVYYAGTSDEEAQFIRDWPLGSTGSYVLNSNHEMYSGGGPYFSQALQSDRLGPQIYSYFALSTSRWLFIGLDSAYNATRGGITPYDVGHLPAGDPQVTWLKWLLASRHAVGPDGTPKRLCVLTHHQGVETNGATTELMNEVVEALGRAPDLWYWGHIHGAAVYAPRDMGGVPFRGRLLGHGGIPYISDFLPENDKLNGIVWAERDLAKPGAVGQNGFAVLRLSAGGGIAEEFCNEKGQKRFQGVM